MNALNVTTFKDINGRWNSLASDGSFTVHRTGDTEEQARESAESAYRDSKISVQEFMENQFANPETKAVYERLAKR